MDRELPLLHRLHPSTVCIRRTKEPTILADWRSTFGCGIRNLISCSGLPGSLVSNEVGWGLDSLTLFCSLGFQRYPF